MKKKIVINLKENLKQDAIQQLKIMDVPTDSKFVRIFKDYNISLYDELDNSCTLDKLVMDIVDIFGDVDEFNKFYIHEKFNKLIKWVKFIY